MLHQSRVSGVVARRLPAVGKAVGRQCLAGTNLSEGCWGRAEAGSTADRYPKKGVGRGCPPPPSGKAAATAVRVSTGSGGAPKTDGDDAKMDGTLHHRGTIRGHKRVHRPFCHAVLPSCRTLSSVPTPPAPAIACAGASPAIAGETSLSLSFSTDCRLPPGYSFRWQYVTPAGRAYPIATAGPFPARLRVPAPWPPPPATAVPLTFGVCVQDPSASVVGPMLGNRTAVVHAPACPPAAVCQAAGLWAGPPLHLRCWLCRGAAAPGYVRGHVLPHAHLHDCSAVDVGQLLVLMQTLREAFATEVLDRKEAGLCCALVLAQARVRGTRCAETKDAEALDAARAARPVGRPGAGMHVCRVLCFWCPFVCLWACGRGEAGLIGVFTLKKCAGASSPRVPQLPIVVLRQACSYLINGLFPLRPPTALKDGPAGGLPTAVSAKRRWLSASCWRLMSNVLFISTVHLSAFDLLQTSECISGGLEPSLCVVP